MNSLLYNYMIGSFLAVFGVGGAFMFTNLNIRTKICEYSVLLWLFQKFLTTVVSISVLPLVIILLSTRVKLIDSGDIQDFPFWNWAIVSLFITIVYSVLTARFLSKDIITPIYQLKNLMESVGTSKYSEPNSMVYTDEFAELFKGFHE